MSMFFNFFFTYFQLKNLQVDETIKGIKKTKEEITKRVQESILIDEIANQDIAIKMLAKINVMFLVNVFNYFKIILKKIKRNQRILIYVFWVSRLSIAYSKQSRKSFMT